MSTTGEVIITVMLGLPLLYGLMVLTLVAFHGRRRPLRDDDGVWRMPKVTRIDR